MQIFMLTQALCAIILAVTLNTEAKPNGLRIINGDKTKSGKFPYIALVATRRPGTKDGQFVQCGGSIITQYHVLTAGHCIASGQNAVDSHVVDVYVGSRDKRKLLSLDRNVQKKAVRQIHLHPEYEDKTPYGADNDIALLTLSKGIHFNKFVRRICLPKTKDFPEIGEEATIIGWGMTNPEDESSDSSKLLMLQTEVESKENGSEKLMYTDTSKQATCGGDSGGPVTVWSGGKRILAGIVSGGGGERYVVNGKVVDRYCTIGNDFQDEHTRVGWYAGWIQREIKKSLTQIDQTGKRKLIEPCFAE